MRSHLVLAALLASATTAAASSDAAWETFRQEVNDACSALAPKDGETVIEVNPFGSESYGAALIIHTVNDEGADRYVCIYDKTSKKAELTAAFLPPGEITTPVAQPDGTIKPEKSQSTDAHLVK
ncbi:hypothetical protein [Paracoccus aminophilus]|uniref:Uncharacterized protein n=1 Tax=Paracoccus aminophilus JCM 7686 TaxID=1367847 RepID=S5XS68_PARAH|nr:hypothetical protein [Paracoccus aminophilus]AGT07962.1 hypothetical protein JCM7686_0853 [Paracoccus aminophilus JCM 7686]